MGELLQELVDEGLLEAYDDGFGIAKPQELSPEAKLRAEFLAEIPTDMRSREAKQRGILWDSLEKTPLGGHATSISPSSAVEHVAAAAEPPAVSATLTPARTTQVRELRFFFQTAAPRSLRFRRVKHFLLPQKPGAPKNIR